MRETDSVRVGPGPRWLELLLLAAGFALAHTQSPLYYSNQNQYFLHGLAASGHGHLAGDWLAQTRDPTPVFSALVATGYRYLGAWSFQAGYFLLLVGYFLSMWGLVRALPGVPDTRGFRLVWSAGFTAAHAAILRVASVEWTGVDYPWYLQAGVAGQYVLGPGLQPSAFGVLLVAGVAAFANGRSVSACGLVGAACLFHGTYLLPAAYLVLGFLIVILRDEASPGPTAFGGMLAASVFMVPTAAFILFAFGTGQPQTFREAQRILAEVRIPHHCNVARWFDAVAGLQVAWAALGVCLTRGNRVFPVLLVALLLGTVLTLVQYHSGDPTLALAFPWRVSVVLVPVASAVIVARSAASVASVASAALSSSVVSGLAAGVMALLAASGVGVMLAGVGYRSGDDEEGLYEFVRANARAEDVFLLPVRIPAVGTGRGAMSASFTPPPRPKPGSNLIPVDLQRFRLHTGARAYVDFKSVPYRDSEVVEWLRRMRSCEAWYDGGWDAPGRWAELRSEGVTHVVARADRPPVAEYLEEVYRDPAYVVYRVR